MIGKNIFNLNVDYKKRDKIMFKRKIDWKKQAGSIKRFRIDFSQLEQLISNNFIDLNMNQNDSPTVEIFYKFLCKYPQLKAVGYAVSPYRNDYRVSIDRITGNFEQWNEDIKKQLIYNLKTVFKDADEFKVDEKEVWVWYD